ncbi:MAG: TIGR02452 family protein [Oscillospiraceae bacterium]|jgi:uncharacterized protein (TIGR02452 family)|nr:TIGR02452 family protein [Oscillospiraceae bacterium]
MARENNVAIYRDTMELINGYMPYKKSTEESTKNTVVYPENFKAEFKGERVSKTVITVVNQGTIGAGLELARFTGRKVAVLNFASANNPGGGVEKGASAQEEAICRLTSLHPCLEDVKRKGLFYGKYKAPFYSDEVIYTPNVLVLKEDTFKAKRLPVGKEEHLDVVSCAAPNQRVRALSRSETRRVFEKRVKNILNVCIENGVQDIVLGAFGCGVFSNPPDVVAETMRNVLSEYVGVFRNVTFAVLARDESDVNLQAFRKVFE